MLPISGLAITFLWILELDLACLFKNMMFVLLFSCTLADVQDVYLAAWRTCTLASAERQILLQSSLMQSRIHSSFNEGKMSRSQAAIIPPNHDSTTSMLNNRHKVLILECGVWFPADIMTPLQFVNSCCGFTSPLDVLPEIWESSRWFFFFFWQRESIFSIASFIILPGTPCFLSTFLTAELGTLTLAKMREAFGCLGVILKCFVNSRRTLCCVLGMNLTGWEFGEDYYSKRYLCQESLWPMASAGWGKLWKQHCTMMTEDLLFLYTCCDFAYTYKRIKFDL